MTDARKNLVHNLLNKIAAEQKYDNPDIETAVIPMTGANFTSQLFTATIKSKGKKDLNLFAKVSATGETLREELGDMFFVERFFYTDLVKKFQALESEHNVPEEQRLIVSKYYGHSEEYLHEVMIFKDLSKEGFVTYDRMKSIDWEYASKAVEQMVKFHALSYALQRDRPVDYKYALEIINQGNLFKDNGALNQYYLKSMPQAIEMAREDVRPKMQKFLEISSGKNYFPKLAESKKRSVILHSDYRPSNLMYANDKDGKVKIAIVDLQTISEGSVAIDLLYFIFTGSDGAFRAQYFDQLIEHYYENLAAALRRLHLDPEEVFPRADFDEELKKALPYGLIVACMIMPFLTVAIEDVANTEEGTFETEGMDDFKNLSVKANGNALCIKRLNEVIEDYVKWGVL